MFSRHPFRAGALGLALSLGLLAPVLTLPMPAQAQVQVDLRDADLRSFVEIVSTATGRNFVVDPAVRGTVTVLAAADAEEAGIEAAIQQGIAIASDILILPHHGRQTPMAVPLLEAVQPTVCLVSNRGGEGSSATGQIARERGMTVLATGRDGNLRLHVEPGQARMLLPGGLRIR